MNNFAKKAMDIIKENLNQKLPYLVFDRYENSINDLLIEHDVKLKTDPNYYVDISIKLQIEDGVSFNENKFLSLAKNKFPNYKFVMKKKSNTATCSIYFKHKTKK